MRILLVSAWEPWRLQDGQSLILHHQLQHLGQDHDIRLLVAEGPAEDPPAGARSSYQAPARVRLRGFPLTAGGAAGFLERRWASHRSGEPAHVHWVERHTLVEALRQELAADVPDVLHLQGWGTAQLSRFAGRIPVAHMAGDCWELGLGGRIVPAYRRAIDAGQRAKVIDHERRHYPEAGAVVLVAERDADHLRARAPAGRYCVIPNGVAAGPGPHPRAWDADAAPVIAFHGSFDTAPNVAAARLLVTEILPLVLAQHPGARVRLIGRHAGREVRRLAGPHVDLSGAVADVRPWLEQAAVYAAPMMSGTGLKNKVLEAMAAGLPVVASPLALAGIGAGGGVTEAADPARMAATLAALLADPDRRRTTGQAGRHRVERDFTWEANASAVTRLWEELMAAAPPPSRDR